MAEDRCVKQTLVSCCFNLGRRDGTDRRPPEFFFRYGACVLELPLPLVLFLDPEFESWAVQERERLGFGEITRIVARPLEASVSEDLVPRLARLACPENVDGARKETPWHLALQYAKLDMVCEALEENPFGTEHYAWIDFGLHHVARRPISFPAPSDRIAVMQMVAVAAREIEDRADFYRYERGRIAGGFLRGHRDSLTDLRQAFDAELAAALAMQLRPNEQMVYSLLAAKRPELFELYYGDYISILLNWDFVRDSFDTVMLNARFCREHVLWESALAVNTAVEASLVQGALALDPDRRAMWLDEYYIAAWYSERPELCARLAGELRVLRHSSYYVEHRHRLEANLKLLG